MARVNKKDLEQREFMEKIKQVDIHKPHCIFCGSRNVRSYYSRGLFKMLVVTCLECKKEYHKVIKKSLTKATGLSTKEE